MHTDRDELATPTPDQRLRAIARIFAAGILRLRARAARPSTTQLSTPKILPESGVNCLEVLGETRLSVPPG
jgi:hypothetical protein